MSHRTTKNGPGCQHGCGELFECLLCSAKESEICGKSCVCGIKLLERVLYLVLRPVVPRAHAHDGHFLPGVEAEVQFVAGHFWNFVICVFLWGKRGVCWRGVDGGLRIVEDFFVWRRNLKTSRGRSPVLLFFSLHDDVFFELVFG